MSEFILKHGDKLQGLMDRFDSSFYCYDMDSLAQHLTLMQESIPEGVRLWYATKANPLSAVLREFREHDFGIDVSAQGEMNHALSAGFDPKNILSTGPSKSRKYLRSLLNHEIGTVVLESLNQALWLDEIAKEMGKKPKVLLRVQLPWSEGKSVLGGDEITAFGIGPETWKNSNVTSLSNLDIVGFHCFQWGNLLDLTRLREIWHTISKVLTDLASDMGVELKVLDLGGGLGLDYEQNERPLDFNEVATLLSDIKNKYDIPEIWMELGRYAVGDFGVYCTQVVDRKCVREREILVTDGGINHIARPALTDQSFPCSLFRHSEKELHSFHVHGPLCTALDKLGQFDLPSDIAPGDWLVMNKAMAYGFTESMPFFLCHNLPGETIIKDNQVEVMRTIETAASWLV